MPIDRRDAAGVLTHALAQDTLARLRSVDTDAAAFRRGLVELGRLCGVELVDDRFETETTTVETPLTTTTGERIRGLDEVVLVTVLRAAVPFVQGLLEVFPGAKQGFVSASRDEAAGMEAGTFPVSTEYVTLPAVDSSDTVVVADPMLATGSTMCAVLDRVLEAGTPGEVLVLSVVAAPSGLETVANAVPEADLLTVTVDDGLDEDGYIVPGLGDAGDRAFRTG